MFYGIENYTLSNSKQQGGFSLSVRFDLMFATYQTSDQEMRETRTQVDICVLLLFILTILIRFPDTVIAEDIKYEISNIKIN